MLARSPISFIFVHGAAVPPQFLVHAWHLPLHFVLQWGDLRQPSSMADTFAVGMQLDLVHYADHRPTGSAASSGMRPGPMVQINGKDLL